MLSSRGLLHINLNVRNSDRSILFYQRALGFEVASDTSTVEDVGAGAEDVRQVILTVSNSGTLLAFTQAESLAVGAPGLNHLGLVVETDGDVAHVLSRVEECGGSIIKSGSCRGAGVSEEFAYIRDPDGYAIEISTQKILYTEFPA